jgi:acetyl-CoA carboxylase carboxyl transferase subunit beta
LNWITNYVRPRINSMLGRREVPENLWIKCPETGELVFHKDLEDNKWVIPASGYHMKMPAKARMTDLFDDGAYEAFALPKVAQDPLKFRDSKKYTDRLRTAASRPAGRHHRCRPRQGAWPEACCRCAGFRFHGRFARHGCR